VSRPPLSLLFIALLAFFLALGRPAITDADEAFYAEASREMVETGDWLTPHFNYEDRWQKPVLYYWLTAATYLATGPSEFGARLWAALSGLGLALLAWRAAAQVSNRADAAWLAGAITATCYGYFAMARAALPDLPLAFCITLGIWMALERRWAIAGAAAGLGFLVKGPVALVIPALVLLPIWWREGTFRTLRARDIAVAAAVFAAIGLPWYVAMWLQHGPAYLESFFVGDNFERFATGRFNEPRGLWFYIPIVIGGMLPWSAYLVACPAASFRRVLARRRRLDRDEWRLLLWALLPLLFYTVSVGKQPRYILPVLPPLAILVACAITRRLAGTAAEPGSGARPPADLRVATWVTVVLYVVLAILMVRARPLFITAPAPVAWMGIAGIIGAAAHLAWLAATRRWARLPVALVSSALVLLLAVQYGALSGRRPEPVEEMAILVRSHRTADEPVGAYEVFVRNLVFYTRFKQVELFDEPRALDFIKSPERVLLVVGRDDLERLELIAGVRMRALGAVQYLDTAKIRLRTLLAPIPAEDLETVLLVTNR
jgi:4-amino-4-deoxy-L-arabinose transferase-like glycosyltransferase